jgi:hypothetical protein
MAVFDQQVFLLEQMATILPPSFVEFPSTLNVIEVCD